MGGGVGSWNVEKNAALRQCTCTASECAYML